MLNRITKIFKPFYTRNFQQLFSEINDPWGYSTSDFEKERFKKISDLAQSVPHMSVLEIGCAEGHLTEKLANFSQNITAIDISETAIGRARQKTPKVVFKKINFDEYQPKNKEFDLIVCSEVLYYFQNKDKILEKIKKSGRYLVVSNAGIWHPFLKKYFKNFKLLKKAVHFKPAELKLTTICLYEL